MYKTLIVDDSKILRTMLKTHLLEADENFKEESIKEASNGKEALDILEDNKFNIVVTDINMPEMDGVEFSKKIKENEELEDTKVVIMTSRSSEEQKNELDKIGIDLFLNKPINKETVKKVILSIVKEAAAKEIAKEKLESTPINLIPSLVETFFYNHIDFEKFSNHSFEEDHVNIFYESFKTTLEERLENENEADTLAEFIANRYTTKIIEALSDIFIFEYGGGNNDVKRFLSYYTGGMRVLDGQRYKIPAILDKDGAVITANTISIISQQYFKQKTYINTLTENIKKLEAPHKELMYRYKEMKDNAPKSEDGEEIVSEESGKLKVVEEEFKESNKKLSQAKERFQKQEEIFAQHTARFKMLSSALTSALLKKKELVSFK